MNRRGFIVKGVMGCAGILASRKAPAAVVKSLLGGYGIYKAGNAGEPFINPYVTDGLVAMWDGEWNAGPGVHKDNPDKWIDIIGGVKAQKTGSGHFFDANAFVGNGTCGWSFTPPNSIFEAIYDASVPITLETCVEYDDTIQTGIGGNYRHNFVVIGRYTTNNLLWNPSFLHNYNRFTGLKICSPSAESFYNKNLTYFHGTLASTRNHIYKNAVSTSANSSLVFTSAYKEASFAIGYGYNSGWKTFYVVCRIHSVRMYARVLSSSEIEHNYLIDKERFGL